ncbi:hypothetical protein KXQ82_10155 [Mucilaginibacter sp. HMF5004]|uniref:hypothetical protein n=1 Tax=Mucilaginibacter rivuli TaxID=2857527 RepID=UPI001C5F0751|nr:hypothetical protein [Mucilaginibacter rivuli]MBW4890081.1 hypothetical protein [Mucilaginibacter rivuli]
MSKSNSFFILSAKKWSTYFPLQVVYEWEEVISEKLGIPIDYDSQQIANSLFDKQPNNWLQKIVRRTPLKNFIDSSFNYFQRIRKGEYIISFLLNPIDIPNHYIYQENSVVILLDVFANNIDLVPQYFKNKLIFVTNIEVLDHFKGKAIAQRMRYIPLSISDKYFNANVPVKKIDVLQMGRQNPVLHEWMLKVTNKYPEIEYVYAKNENGINVYFSTTKGILNEKTGSREEFMAFLGSAKVSLLSAPGIDGGDQIRTGGFNPVTPRFYESAVNYCYMIGRYPDAPDFELNKISSVCERPENYDEFEKAVLSMLKTPFNLQDKYNVFIKQHLTSTVAQSIKQELEKL